MNYGPRPNFQAGTLWRHERFMDVDMKIIKVQWVGHYVKLKVSWVHRRLGDLQVRAQSVKVKQDQYKYWKQVDYPHR